MSCWVVPTIAAEFLGIPLAQVLERARKGTIPTKRELGFMVVDVAPHSPKITAGIRQPTSRPATYISLPSTELTEQEEAALSGDGGGTAAAEPPLSARELAELNGTDEPTPIVYIEEAADIDLDEQPEEGRLDWHQARQQASRQRRAPRRLQELAA
jgi:hypothetical protein